VVAKERGVPGVALVTGAACGIGFEVARQFARRRMTVILGARDAENGEAAAEELAGPVDVAEGEGLKGSPG
jgi:short-subunit dehydrogenase